jgi:purine-binding chemotaxis protein CheW
MTDANAASDRTAMPTDESKASILRARAQALAVEPPQPPTTSGQIEVVEFQLARENYAIESNWVKEVHPLKDLTPVPCAPPFVFGIINVRGQILTVIDLRTFFNLPFKGITNLHTVIILKNEHMELGILADAITGAKSVSLDAIQPTLPTLHGVRAQYLRGVTDDRVVIIDAARLMSANEIIVNQEFEAVG